MKNYQFKLNSQCETKGYFDYTLEKTIIEVEAENEKEALKELCEILHNDYYYTITENAIKNKSPMYRDTKDGQKQVGYVITAHSEIFNDQKYKWVKTVSSLWTEIKIFEYNDFNQNNQAL